MRRRYPNQDNPNSKKSVHYVSEKRRPIDFPKLYTHMFIEDLHLGVMPIGGRSKRKDFKVELISQNQNIEEMICQALSSSYGAQRDIGAALSHFVDEVVHTLAYFGKAYYEIVYYFEDESKNKITAFELDRVSNNNIAEIFGHYFQFVPKSRYPSFDKEKSDRRFIYLPKREILKFNLPALVGNDLTHKLLLNRLDLLSKSIFPDFTNTGYFTLNEIGFDYLTYHRNKDLEALKITRDYGWTGRSKLSDEQTSLYLLYRHLRFAKIKALFRDEILTQLNRKLKNVGKIMNFDAQIKIDGLPEPKELDAYIEKLFSGKVTFDEVVQLTMM